MVPACWLCGSVGGGFRKRHLPNFLSVRKLSPSSFPDAGNFSSSLYATGAFQAAVVVLELRGSESKYASPCVGSLRETAPDFRSFFR